MALCYFSVPLSRTGRSTETSAKPDPSAAARRGLDLLDLSGKDPTRPAARLRDRPWTVFVHTRPETREPQIGWTMQTWWSSRDAAFRGGLIYRFRGYGVS